RCAKRKTQLQPRRPLWATPRRYNQHIRFRKNAAWRGNWNAGTLTWMTDASTPLRLAPATDGGPVGPVMVIGGAEDKLGERVILSRFVQLAGGARARIRVISST